VQIVEHMKIRIRVQNVESETPLAFLHKLRQSTNIDRKPLKFTYSRLNSLLRTLQVTSLDEYNPLQHVADFATLVSTYQDGFAIVIEPNGSVIPGIYEPVMQLACLDSSLAIKPVFERFRSVIITSGTLSPIELYPKLLVRLCWVSSASA
jgi:DNA excision repair protein ERCC-2